MATFSLLAAALCTAQQAVDQRKVEFTCQQHVFQLNCKLTELATTSLLSSEIIQHQMECACAC